MVDQVLAWLTMLVGAKELEEMADDDSQWLSPGENN
jgi:hypothetical protein